MTFLSYVTKEQANRPTKPIAAPPTAVILQPRMSVKTLTMGEQKKIIPMEREPTQAAGDKMVTVNKNAITRWTDHSEDIEKNIGI